MEIDKERVLATLRSRVGETLTGLVESQKTSQAGATHEETRAEDPKDMRSTEASYLARGLAQRVEDLQEEARRLALFSLRSFGPEDPAAISALVGLEDDAGTRTVVFLVEAGAGEDLEVDGASIRPVTPASPLGRAVVGAQVGDDIEVELPGGKRDMMVLWIR